MTDEEREAVEQAAAEDAPLTDAERDLITRALCGPTHGCLGAA